MASNSRQKTTMAKLARERALRERRELKQAKKDARKRAAAVSPDAGSEDEATEPAGDSGPAGPERAAD